jgi:GNAT superfamily N-acetyltransferase
MKIIFNPCEWQEIHDLVENHVKHNKITVDSFWEGHILDSNHYKMTAGDETVGWFAIHGGHTIMLFHVLPYFANQAQELFERVKKYEQVTSAMLPTGDEFFMSHCFDNFARIEKQAYFSIYTDKCIPEERKKALTLTLADVDKDAEILILSGDFLDEIIEEISEGSTHIEVYIAKHDENIIGFGVVDYGRLFRDSDIASIGMYVREEFRRQGFAANILEHLKHVCISKGFRVFSGCWYYNHNSKKSMESAGAYIKTRLIKFFF